MTYAEIASVLPLQIICEMMGIPRESWTRIMELTNVILGGGDPELTPDFGTLLAASLEMAAIAQAVGEDRLANPRDDLVSALMHASVDGESLTPQEMASFFILLAAAGNETTPGSFLRLTSTTGGAQESRFVGGSQRVSLEMAKRLGSRIVLRAPVRRIEQRGGECRVVSDRGTFRAKQVIVAVPPAVSAFIDYDPILPFDRAQLLQRFPQGSVIKCQAVYDKPFWRDEGLSGYVNSDEGPVKLMYDNSPPDGSKGVLLGFIEGQEARRASRLSPSARKAAVLANFAKTIGPQAGRPKQFVEKNWSTEEWTRGCYGGFLPPGVWTDYGSAVRAAHGRIHWAGAEHATIWNGYMDGALRSGEDAAKAAMKKL